MSKYWRILKKLFGQQQNLNELLTLKIEIFKLLVCL